MVKDRYQFIFSISSSDAWANSVLKSSGNHAKPSYGACRTTRHDRFMRIILAFFQFKFWASVIQAVLTGVVIATASPMNASASKATLTWNDNNPAVVGYQVFQRAEGESYDYTRPTWPTDGCDHRQTSCTISDLTAGEKYYFVVRAYADGYQSAVSNEVSFTASSSSDSAIEDENQPPEQPTLISITDSGSNVSLTPQLAASEFSDPDPGDSHTGTEWRIFQTSDDQQIVFDRTCNKGDLFKIRIPLLVLEPSTEYVAQVRFFDDHGIPSPWSLPVDFTTPTDANDQNLNNIPDDQEILTFMDMNGDAVSDLDQPSVVKSLFTYDEQHTIGISVELNDPTVQILAAASIAPSTLVYSSQAVPITGDNMPYGLTCYRIEVEPSEIITVALNLSDPLPPNKTHWIRYDAVDGITNCDASTDVSENDRVVYRYLADGGDEDADGVANGIIVDLSGPMEGDPNDSGLATSDDGADSNGGGSGGCFIQSLL